MQIRDQPTRLRGQRILSRHAVLTVEGKRDQCRHELRRGIERRSTIRVALVQNELRQRRRVNSETSALTAEQAVEPVQ